MSRERLRSRFPGLATRSFRITSPRTGAYNCIAWATGDQGRWWCPDDFELYYWPEAVPKENTVEAWEAALATVGYERCEDGALEEGFTRVAVYAQRGDPLHVARQLPSGRWTSKLGASEDIEHELEALGGESGYGQVVLFLRRREQHPG